MDPSNHGLRRIYLPLLSTFTSILLLVVIALTGKDAAISGVTVPGFQSTSVAALICSILALTSVITVTLFKTNLVSTSRLDHNYLVYIGAIIGLVSAVLTADVFVLQKSGSQTFPIFRSVSPTAQIVVWVLATLLELIFYALCFFVRAPRVEHSVEKGVSPIPTRPKTPPTPLRMLAPPGSLSQTTGPLRFPPPVQKPVSFSSWRSSLNSLQQSIRPASSVSKRRSTITTAMTARSSVTSETRSLASSDIFAEWWDYSTSSPNTSASNSPASSNEDTSPLADRARSRPRSRSLHIGPPAFGTALDPIPGSRPTSPADKLTPDSPTSIYDMDHSIDKALDIAIPSTPPPRDRDDDKRKRPSTAYSGYSFAVTAAPANSPQISRPPTAYSTYSLATTRRFSANSNASTHLPPPPPPPSSLVRASGAYSSFSSQPPLTGTSFAFSTRPPSAASTSISCAMLATATLASVTGINGANIPQSKTSANTTTIVSNEKPVIVNTTTNTNTNTANTSRRNSNNEAHIHPLFRTDSPTPPPVASPGTVVQHHPLAGMVLRRDASPRGSTAIGSSSNRRRSSSSPLRESTSSSPMPPVVVDETVLEVEESEKEAQKPLEREQDEEDIDHTIDDTDDDFARYLDYADETEAMEEEEEEEEAERQREAAKELRVVVTAPTPPVVLETPTKRVAQVVVQQRPSHHQVQVRKGSMGKILPPFVLTASSEKII